ncbi:MAG: hypothetical protein JWQ31_585, partial [Mycobacterium sp.]|nr:hypothetical protein [Mycobacterium sp.]
SEVEATARVGHNEARHVGGSVRRRITNDSDASSQSVFNRLSDRLVVVAQNNVGTTTVYG